MSQTTTKVARQTIVTGQIDQILSSIEASRTKSAAAHTEGGSIGGETTHPVKDVDDNTSKATEGFRSKENEGDVKEQQGSPSVNSTSPATTGGQASAQYNIGTNAGETGTNVPKAKGGKEDGGTYNGSSSHPARTDNNELEGGKYASVSEAIASLRHHTKIAGDVGTELLGVLSIPGNDQVPAKQAGASTAPAGQATGETATAPASNKQAGATAAEEAQVGYDFASVLTEDFDKQALDRLVIDSLAETVDVAEGQAEKVAAFLDDFYANVGKQASDEEGGEPGESEGGDGSESSSPVGEGGGEDLGAPPMPGGDAGGGAPPMPGGDMGGAGGGQIDPAMIQQLIQLLLAQQGGGAGAPGGAPEGDPAAMLQGGQGMGGGDAMAGMSAPADAGGGEMPPDMGGGEGMGMIHQAMAILGTTPAEVELKSTQKLASMLQAHIKKGGKVPPFTPKTAQEQKALDSMVGYLAELTGRSR